MALGRLFLPILIPPGGFNVVSFLSDLVLAVGQVLRDLIGTCTRSSRRRGGVAWVGGMDGNFVKRVGRHGFCRAFCDDSPSAYMLNDLSGVRQFSSSTNSFAFQGQTSALSQVTQSDHFWRFSDVDAVNQAALKGRLSKPGWVGALAPQASGCAGTGPSIISFLQGETLSDQATNAWHGIGRTTERRRRLGKFWRFEVASLGCRGNEFAFNLLYLRSIILADRPPHIFIMRRFIIYHFKGHWVYRGFAACLL